MGLDDLGTDYYPSDLPEIGGWWVISTRRLRHLLTRAHAGEPPDLIVLEEYGNSDVDDANEDEEDDNE